MFPPKSVYEHERLGKLFGLYEKSCAINLPLTADLHLLPPLGEVVGEFEFTKLRFSIDDFFSAQMLLAGFYLACELECTRGIGRGQFHKFGARGKS